ncbi:MAG: 3-deoxy-D-manno-octulosonic acid transferase [Chthoniobacterales bacterium]|nr:3-deoxy-D-manno-octulosonic acid transferase [Chthoniobacterales bacterium]
MRFLYNAVFPLVLLLSLPAYLLRMMSRGNYRRDFAQRFGRYSPELRKRLAAGEWFWVHAVSVGELLVALKIIGELRRRHPTWQFVVTSTTSTAHGIALEKATDWWVPLYTPVDFSAFVRRALGSVKPRAVVLVEGEMWPNFMWACADRGIPVVLANARVSPRSARRYEKFAAVARSITRHLSAVGVQHAADAALWHKLGVPAADTIVTGSVKFDPATAASPRDFRPVLDAWGVGRNDPVFIAGSTHPGEEELLVESFRAIRGKIPLARLLLAPRHVERTAGILATLGKSGFRAVRRTDEPAGVAPDILLIDTTGELPDWYACADVVFVGKSLAGHGGQNPVEAILAGRPAVFGPHMENFAALTAELLSAGGAIQVDDAEELGNVVVGLLADAQKRAGIAARGAAALDAHRGATARTADLLERVVAKG